MLLYNLASSNCIFVGWTLQVSSVKRQIEESQGREAFPCAQQLLIHQGKVLKDDTTMTDNKVSENGFLVVMLTKVMCITKEAWGWYSCVLEVFCYVCWSSLLSTIFSCLEQVGMLTLVVLVLLGMQQWLESPARLIMQNQRMYLEFEHNRLNCE